jgi:hypothetical protein
VVVDKVGPKWVYFINPLTAKRHKVSRRDWDRLKEVKL